MLRFMTIPAQLDRTRRFTLGAPSQITISPDGRTLFFLRSGRLWSMTDGREHLVADRDVDSYAADEACQVLACTAGGRLWTVRPADGVVRDVPADGPVTDPRPDPTGRRIAYVRDGALYVDGRPLAVPEGPEVTYGLPEDVAAGSIGRTRGYWWAPDGQALLVARVDNTPVQRWYIADPADPAREPRVIRYPSAGTPNAEVSLWIIGLDGGRTPVDIRGMEYLTAAGWDAHGPYAAVQSRDQRHVRVLAVDPGTGATEVLAEQHDEHWVRLVPGLPARSTAGVLYTSADLDDTRRLLADGKPVTPPGLQLGEVVAVDGEAVLFTACDEPTETHLWLYDGELRRLSDEPGVHTGTRRGGTTVLGRRVLGTGAEIASHAERPALDLRMELRAVGPRALRTALFLPSWHRPSDGPLPVLMDPYGGPALRKVTVEPAWWTYVSQWFAEHGFAVLAVDGRGTPGRGPAWEREIVGDLAGPVLADQVEALHAYDHPALDLTRVAIRGWSFGGFLAAMAVLRRPDVFHAAIAGAPVTDQRMYDTHFRERHLGHPARNPEAYDRSSPLLEAAELTRPLLLIHGLADDNVVAAHTLRFSAALLAAGRPHEVLPLPGAGHRASQEHLLAHQLDFLRRALGLTGRQ